ncbi:cation:proton antiporter [Nitrosomonas halophila]|uniref:Monovalent cation:H+ antiporter-2, CPA2 family n=1 Tax=Nitrosomonas halophila TaxID=44576 RepID=A0A1H3GMA8_9PROT|nr:cation:proton antiporter [Nitrosomonas halophila]SDY03449.1 monovalent cation:H+ antiporter-2, CPA2 family [Nitrosomonas halophila]
MLDETLMQLLLLLSATVAAVLGFHKLHIPPSLAYLLVGVLLGPHTAGPVIDNGYIGLIAEFGIVFLLFTIGLSFSLAHIYSLRHMILGLGSAQVAFTTIIVAAGLWLLDTDARVAFVIGAVFAQSSTTIIAKQLSEVGEEHARHGRLGIALSVFQDITAVPFVIIIPVLGIAASDAVIGALGWALIKAILAIAIMVICGRYLLKPLFHQVAQKRSAELFTLTVLFVCILSAWITKSFGLSMAFGAFLAGMMLAETEFRHQVEATIRPFRDVLLGLFFISIGMLMDPGVLPQIWPQALAGAVALLLIKLLLVTTIVRLARIDWNTALRVGLILAVGGEFGFALLAIAIGSEVIAQQFAQIALTSVLISMVIAPFMIRYNRLLAAEIMPLPAEKKREEAGEGDSIHSHGASNHVVICGFGRIGQLVSRCLEAENIPYIALDMDASRVREARLAGYPVYYADSAEMSVLEAVNIAAARLLLISHDDTTAALKTLENVKHLKADLTVLVRTRDESHLAELKAAGATEVIPETLEAGMMLISHALLALKKPLDTVAQYIQEQRMNRYQMLRELLSGSGTAFDQPEERLADRLYPISLDDKSPAVGRRLADLTINADNLVVTALVRDGQRKLSPSLDTVLQANDVLVLFGSADGLQRAEVLLTGIKQPPIE